MRRDHVFESGEIHRRRLSVERNFRCPRRIRRRASWRPIDWSTSRWCRNRSADRSEYRWRAIRKDCSRPVCRSDSRSCGSGEAQRLHALDAERLNDGFHPLPILALPWHRHADGERGGDQRIVFFHEIVLVRPASIGALRGQQQGEFGNRGRNRGGVVITKSGRPGFACRAFETGDAIVLVMVAQPLEPFEEARIVVGDAAPRVTRGLRRRWSIRSCGISRYPHPYGWCLNRANRRRLC